jgi:hypothetical protein
MKKPKKESKKHIFKNLFDALILRLTCNKV